MTNRQNKYNKRSVINIASAFLAFVIGSGFATGQEVLQFFTSYGYLSYAIVLINLIGFLFIGQVLLITGHEHRKEESFNQFKFFCGERLGAFYSWLHPITLLLLLPVLVAGAGATVPENFGISHYIGSAIVVLMILLAYLIGFDKLVKILSIIGPSVIIFSLLVSIITVFRDFHNFVEFPRHLPVLEGLQSSPHWLLSSILYVAMVFFNGSAYFTGLGRSSINKNDVKYGSILGAIVLMVVIAIINTAMLLNAESISTLEVPMLFLGRKISYIFGDIFSIILILGTFSSCSTMMWSVCKGFTRGGERGNQIFAVVISIYIFVFGLFPFAKLVSILFPLIGYVGLIYIACLVYKGVKSYKDTKAYKVEESYEGIE